MNVHLMHRRRDFDPNAAPAPGADAVAEDLDLGTLLQAMSRGDRLVRRVCETALLGPRAEADAIRHRQEILADFLREPAMARRLYDVAVEATTGARKVHYSWSKDSPDAILSNAVRLLEFYVPVLRNLRRIAESSRGSAASPGLGSLFDTMSTELDENYLRTVEGHLGRLRFRGGTLLSAELGPGNEGTNYVARAPRHLPWRLRIGWWRRRSPFAFDVHPRDDNGFRALAAMRGMAINNAANALARAADHVRGFVTVLQNELAFYVGCINLHERLRGAGVTTSFPEAGGGDGEPELSGTGLVDPCLALHLDGAVVANDVAADGTRLLVVTGANRGGKTTFLRSVGLAQLMLECGMFVAAAGFRSSLSGGTFTHFRREEDPTMRRGKLEEELARLSDIVDQVGGGDMLLCNESLSSTNEREGSRIAGDVVRALTEQGVRVIYVTHLYDLARGFDEIGGKPAVFLRAERMDDGRRTFRMVEGEPLPTSYGEDLYREIFGAG